MISVGVAPHKAHISQSTELKIQIFQPQLGENSSPDADHSELVQIVQS